MRTPVLNILKEELLEIDAEIAALQFRRNALLLLQSIAPGEIHPPPAVAEAIHPVHRLTLIPGGLSAH